MSDLKRFRDEVPFGDDVLREIRNDVMKSIERESRREPRWLGMILRASFAVALIVFVVWQTGESPSRRVVDSPSVPVVEPVHQPVAIASNPPETRKLEDPETPNVRRAARRRTRITRPAPEPAFAEPAAVRIELHTSNPDIRILWINQPSGETR
jgi:hypothetical protein